MLVLTFVTGLVDAVGYLGLDRIFTGNMTGNLVILGMGLAAEDDLPVVGPLVALGAYALGAAIAGRLLRGPLTSRQSRVTRIFTFNAAVLTAVGVTLATVAVTAPSPLSISAAGSIAVLMGMQAATARALAVADMTTVVVTSTITAFASETLFEPGWAWFKHRRLWAILAIFAGALVGALLMKIHISIPVFVAALATAVVAVVGHRVWELPE
jgi:uncharacterized membrane protein YoaK (UPF0700 family)